MNSIINVAILEGQPRFGPRESKRKTPFVNCNISDLSVVSCFYIGSNHFVRVRVKLAALMASVSLADSTLPFLLVTLRFPPVHRHIHYLKRKSESEVCFSSYWSSLNVVGRIALYNKRQNTGMVSTEMPSLIADFMRF